ncbi:Tetratricopeptide repeat-containing protein [Lentibacillus persicus]|uniref:Tetratricopeptide repeat-containing protein n=1 Tax=Lentibacillus persicus TaxID=640948 RepID=A0A1I1WM69_9BACI|nr:hypothetical protein [Lentibacillus persicus]SFD96172.1 Tetratricopeptide repeat-containing protein [Lentibacillus persicus]
MQQLDNGVQRLDEKIIPFIPDGDFYFTKGAEAFQKDKFETAIKWLRKAIEAEPKNPLYQCQMSIVYTEIGAYHAANQLLNDVLEATNEQYTDCYYLLANNYAHLGLLNEAKKYAKIYLDHSAGGDFRSDAEHLMDLMHIDEEEGSNDWQFDEEDELLIYQETIFRHMEDSEWRKAIPLLEEMLVLFPEHKSIKHDYTYALFFSGHTRDAINMELETLAEEPDSLNSHTNLTMFYYESGRIKDYERHINALSNVYPMHEQQKLRIAVTFARTGAFKWAHARFKQLAKWKLKNHKTYFKWYSITAFQLGEPSKALALWKEGCKRHPQLAEEEGPWKRQ